MTTARVFQINVSKGGVPKHGVHRANVTADGVEGDGQNNRKDHGGPDRAVCLFSLERILAWQAQGHPIFPGANGENLTISGLDWDRIVPGTQLLIGDSVMLEIVSYTAPCAKIQASFADGDITRHSQKHNPGWSRLYARVLVPGVVKVGDSVLPGPRTLTLQSTG